MNSQFQKNARRRIAKRRASQGYIWWMAWRNFSARKQGGGLSFMTTVSIVGVSIGVAALIVVLSVMGGFEQDLRRKMLMGQPHLQILAENATGGISLKEHPLKKFRNLFPEAVGMEPFIETDVVLKRRNFIASASMIGIEPEHRGNLWGFRDSPEVYFEGSLASLSDKHPVTGTGNTALGKLDGIMLGEKLATQLGADIGDEIIAVSPQAGVGSMLSGGTLARSFVVVGKFGSGMFDYDSKWAVVNLSAGRRFLPDYDESLDRDEYVTGVGVNVKNPIDIGSLSSRIDAKSGLQVLTWQMTNKSLLFALKLEKFAMGSILMLIVVVAAFSISGTMMMTVFHKRAQVSLLRSLGMSRWAIVRLYLSHGFTIGTVGILVGLTMGILVCLAIKSFNFIPLPPQTYYLKALPVKFLPFEYAVICLSAWLFSLAAATYPAFTASRQNPSLGLRFE